MSLKEDVRRVEEYNAREHILPSYDGIDVIRQALKENIDVNACTKAEYYANVSLIEWIIQQYREGNEVLRCIGGCQ